MGAGDMENDERFKHISKDPKFKRIPYEKRKVKIDKRFQSMFKDEKFKVTYTVDKRGFPVKQSTTDDFKKFYNLNRESKQSSEESEEGDNEEEEAKDKKQSDNDNDSDDSDVSVDYARGVGVRNDIESSSDEESSEEEAEDEKIEHGWGELDQDAERTEEVTNRLACMHMDWDRIKAKDLMVLFNSFLPQGGQIKAVTIYPSEFGKQRMAEEEVKGPLELVEHSEDDPDGQSTEGNAYHREKLRKYQLNRLKYYYAIVVFDSPESANKVYAECDGMEYESSATRLDVRFVPDDTTFDEEPKESCTELPDLTKYKPRYFMNSALQQVKVNLTWDETDPDRVEAVSKLMNGEVDEDNLRNYLATSSEEEDDAVEDSEVHTNAFFKDNNTDNENKEEVINKYRSLLKSITEEEDKKKSGVEMEISWGVGLEKKTKEIMKEKMKTQMTPFQKLLEKKKEKRKQKKNEKQNQKQDGEEDENDDNDIPSDIDLSDPYFKEEIDAMKLNLNKTKYKPQLHSSDYEDNEAHAQTQANLELLLMDDNVNSRESNGKHFNMKKIQEENGKRESKKKKKKSLKSYKKKKIEEKTLAKEENDEFEVDVKDSRFGAVYTSHHFNIDPADPHFKKTKAMQAIIQEKLVRRGDLNADEPSEKRSKKKR